jgi:DnaJ-domain-containing protein 1
MEASTDLQRLLEQILRAHPTGLTEFQLLRRLQAEDPEGFPKDLFADSQALFRAHFLLFHALYRMRDNLVREHRAILEIDVLGIALRSYAKSGDTQLERADALRDYYLDLGNLRNTDADDLERMLGRFWVRYYANGRRAEALQVLGLEDPVDAATVIRRYRQLAMRHHPDRGGDSGCFRAIREAMEILRRC